MAHQGYTDIDTGSFTGLERAYRQYSDKDFTPEQKAEAKKKAKASKESTQVADEATKKVNEVIQAPTDVDPRVKSLVDRITENLHKEAASALERIKKRRAEGRLFTGIDPVDLADYAVYGAAKMTEGFLVFSKWSAEMVKDIGEYIKPHLQQIWDATNERLDKEAKSAPKKDQETVKRTIRKQSAVDAEKAALDAAHKTVRENAVRLAEAENKARVAKTVQEKKAADVQKLAAQKAVKSAQESVKQAAIRLAKEESKVKERAKVDEQAKAERAALEAAQRTVTENAKRIADAENKARVAKSAKERADAIKERREAQKIINAKNREIRQAAAALAKKERILQGDPIKRVWTKVREYLDKGETDQDVIRTKVAADLGITTEQVYRALARDNNVKRLMDDMWKKQQAARLMKERAKRWVASLDDPALQKYLQVVPNFMFKAKVFGHAGVAIGTHAPVPAWQLRYWKLTAQNYWRMLKLASSRSRYERMRADLERSKNYVKAQRFGLKNDFTLDDEFNSDPILNFSSTRAGVGTRGYSVLKFFRQDMFDRIWDNLPESQKTDGVGWIIANRINHMTGTLSDVPPPKSLGTGIKPDMHPFRGAATVGFAPTLLLSRARVLFRDPAQSLGILARWKTASPGEKMAVKLDIADRAWATGTMLALLGVNAGLLAAAGSKQKINFTDPTRSDWMKFKGGGHDFAFGNAIMSMGRFPLRSADTIAEGKGRGHSMPDESIYTAAGQFLRSQLSPFMGVTTDLALGSDYSRRPLPRKLFGTMEQTAPVPLRLRREGVKPYTWNEYFWQSASPIPFQEGLKEAWKQGWGMSDKQIDAYMKAIAISIIMGSTGGRVSEDYEANKPAPLSGF